MTLNAAELTTYHCEPNVQPYGGRYKSSIKLISLPFDIITLISRHVCAFPRISNYFYALSVIWRVERMQIYKFGTAYGQQKNYSIKIVCKTITKARGDYSSCFCFLSSF
jgi:hypothetical protein